MNIALLLTVSPFNNFFFKRISISISPLRLHFAASVQIPSSTRNFYTMFPYVKVRPLNILSASSVNLHGITSSNVFHNNLRTRLSPLNRLFLGNTKYF